MLAYKGFDKGLQCRGYQFVMGLNTTEKANCAQNGFHCAENPLDCLCYYGNHQDSVYHIVDAGGDIDEDDRDSKISCTELTVLNQLTIEQLILHGLAYMVDHPNRESSSQVSEDKATACNGYAIVRGLDPVAKGTKVGDILAFAKQSLDGRSIERVAMRKVDGKKVLPDVWYDMELKERGEFL